VGGGERELRKKDWILNQLIGIAIEIHMDKW
jgi:hypothetical protein